MRAPGFWRTGGVPAMLLAPLGRAYAVVAARRLRRPGWRAPVPVICCGNVVAGGAGKTPVAADIGRRLKARGVAVHFLSRGYGGKAKGPLRVDTARHDSRMVGDEALLLAEIAPTWVGRERALSARQAVESGAQAIVMDDGLQNPTLEKTLSILVVDGGYGFGNGRVHPAGPLREPVAAGAARCQAAVLMGSDASGARAQLPPGLPVLEARMAPGPGALALAGKAVMAFAGIANPTRFFDGLAEAGAVLVAREVFADHYPYDDDDIRQLLAEAEGLRALPVTTPKDAVRIRAELREHITVADATLMWTDETALEALLAPLFPAAFAAKAAEDGAPAAAALPDEDGLPSASRGDARTIASPAGTVSATGPAASA
ncbi:MAG: tetraacyldisaccharide 4'-kinase [Alphaproteobacteria bacterium]|nr:tetraacyldisaccharide 4'-kinase [Alphaproteobacteria bacterium]